MSQEKDVQTTQAPKAQHFKVPWPQKVVVGGIAGIIGTTCIFPIDIVKTRLQEQKTKVYKNGLDCFRQIVKREGILGLYSGLFPNLVGVTPEKAIKLVVNDQMREFLEDEHGNLTVMNEVIAGGTAGFCQVVATNPMEIVKIRLQLQGTQGDQAVGRQKNMFGVIRQLGLRGLYLGAPVTLLRDVPFSFIFFPLYSNLKTRLAKNPEAPSMLTLLSSGTLAGAVAASAVTPADVIKTRLQAENTTIVYNGIWDCVKKTYHEGGISVFFRGAVQRASVVAPLFGIALLAFDKQKQWLMERQAKGLE